MHRKTNALVEAIRPTILAAAIAPASVIAGGFSLNEQSASQMGGANAGAAANPEKKPAGNLLNTRSAGFGGQRFSHSRRASKTKNRGPLGTRTDRNTSSRTGGDFQSCRFARA